MHAPRGMSSLAGHEEPGQEREEHERPPSTPARVRRLGAGLLL